jgi:sugar phosphate isomerase/epimerase
VAETLSLPGFVNAHSHAFQRVLRGRNEGDDFWGWREAMLELAASLTTEQVRVGYVQVYREMLDAGYTAVGEFHYLGLAEAQAAVEAAAEAGIELVLLLAAYGRGGIERFRQESVADYLSQLEELRAAGVRVGLAPHSVRACPRDWLEELGRYAVAEGLPLHVHADEQPREIDECLAEYGLRPMELLAETGCLGPQTTVVHATHAGEGELDLLAEANARVCLCPTTEPTWATASRPCRSSASAASACASARTRTSASTRWRSSASSRESPAASPAGATWSPSRRSCALAPTRAPQRWALERWADVQVELDHPSLAGVEDVHAGLVLAVRPTCSPE